MNTNEMLKLYGPPALALILVIILFPLVILQWFSSGQATKKEIVQNEQNLNQILKPKLDFLESSNAEKVSNDIALLRRAVPDNPNIPLVMATASQAASESNLIITSLQLTAVSKSDNNEDIVDTNITVAGTYAELVTFIDKLGKSAPSLMIKSFSIIKETKTSNIISTSFALSAYAKPSANEIPDEGADLKQLTTEEQALLNELRTYTYYQFETAPVTGGKQNLF